jgi:hypothetical protein
MRPSAGLNFVVLAPLPKHLLLGLMNARWISVHEVILRMNMGKRVPLARLQEVL